ncbi:hypothetical protein ACWGDS_13805 [Streptomyces sp. NPDC055059]|jgi:hypothetical protein|uniref:Uncharacterized protein n=1 Tax=Streptomyces sp. NBC_00119 TaxID=2975659 RepID=A0AAU1U7E0_9ACTN|nr:MULTISPECIES: hypothetical protein [unclassified Streptomyces]MCX4643466.1 hypothetical protein [Streptomyces sp. NBC_01446]MCX5324589.1 hypothetical protein [Streptomyces sp. NBC_00120]
MRSPSLANCRSESFMCHHSNKRIRKADEEELVFTVPQRGTYVSPATQPVDPAAEADE